MMATKKLSEIVLIKTTSLSMIMVPDMRMTAAKYGTSRPPSTTAMRATNYPHEARPLSGKGRRSNNGKKR